MENKLYIVYYRHEVYVEEGDFNAHNARVLAGFKTKKEAEDFINYHSNKALEERRFESKTYSGFNRISGDETVTVFWTRDGYEHNYRTYFIQEIENPYQEELDAKK